MYSVYESRPSFLGGTYFFVGHKETVTIKTFLHLKDYTQDPVCLQRDADRVLRMDKTKIPIILSEFEGWE